MSQGSVKSSSTTTLRAALALVAALPAGSAAAMHEAPPADSAPTRHIVFGGFYEFPDSARNVDDGLGTHYGYGRSLGASRAWELRLFGGTRETGIKGATDFYHYGLGLDLFQYFGNTSAGHPYALAGVGAIFNDVDPDDQDGASGYGNLALGWRGAPLEGWGLRPRYEVRATYDTFDSGQGSGQVDVLLGVALEISAARTVIQEKLVEKTVEVVVAPPDLDGDGVPDTLDQCPDTVPNAKVETDGCVRKAQVVVLPNIEFALDKADLTPAGKDVLEKVVRFMNDQPEITLDVWGHTDWTGSAVYNLGLSQRRAASAVQYLIERGIAAERVKSAGFGESRPLASNETEEGRERNRRVELNIRTRPGGKP